MLRWLAIVLAAAGCYSPTPPSGAPCSNGQCPSGLECIADVCVTPGSQSGLDASREDASQGDAGTDGADPDADPPPIDAIVDAVPIADVDADGVPDQDDNCPTIANPNQRNHDADARGDVCDVCPHIADDGADQDGDLVGDLCDPNPSNNRERPVLFEGFYDGIPATWVPNGPLTTVPGGLRVDLGLSERANLSAPNTPPDMAVLVGSVTPLAEVGPDSRGIGIAMPQTSGTDGGLGVACELAFAVNGTTPGLVIVNIGQGSFANSVAYPFVMGQPYRLTLVRRNNEFRCTAEGNGGPPVTITANINGQIPAQPRWGFRAKGMTGTIDYLFYLEND
jgi:hypothetical protein